jgi:biotin operon repressor
LTDSGNNRELSECPRCGEQGYGPYRKRAGNGHFGTFFVHAFVEDGLRRLRWHYVPNARPSTERRERLVRLVKQQGWRGTRYYASLLKVSERTIRRDLDALRAEGRIIHQNYGGYIADPPGTLLKEKPWIAWS